MNHSTTNQSISIIIPVFNEEKSLHLLYDEIKTAILNYANYEIIFINDGSSDSSFLKISELVEKDSNVVLIDFFTNSGKADALNEGFKISKGDIIITMDADLQDDPSEINNLISKINQGWDLVSGWKKHRNDPISKKWPSKFFNFVMRYLTKVKINDFNCGLKAYKKKVIKTLELYGGMHRYIPAIVSKNGFSVTEVPVNHRARKFGYTKYGRSRFFHGFYDLFTVLFIGKYLSRPLHFFGSIGFTLISVGFIISLYLTLGWLNGIWIANRPMFFLGILLLILGVQFFSMGLIGELIIKISHQNKNIPLKVYKKEI